MGSHGNCTIGFFNITSPRPHAHLYNTLQTARAVLARPPTQQDRWPHPAGDIASLATCAAVAARALRFATLTENAPHASDAPNPLRAINQRALRVQRAWPRDSHCAGASAECSTVPPPPHGEAGCGAAREPPPPWGQCRSHQQGRTVQGQALSCLPPPVCP